MTTLELKIESKNDVTTHNLLLLLKSFKGVKIKEKKIYSEVEKSLTSALQDLTLYKEGKLQFENAEDFLKTL